MTGIWASEPLAVPSTDPVPEPVRCEVGIYGHRWILTIEESQRTLTLDSGEVCPSAIPPWGGEPRPVCEIGLEGFEAADFSMATELPVRLTDGTDCPGSGAAEMGSHYVDHNPGGICDCDHWLEIVPVERFADPRFTGSPETIVRALAAQEVWHYDFQGCNSCSASVEWPDPMATSDPGEAFADHDDDCPYAAALAWVAAHPPPPPVEVHHHHDHPSMHLFITDRQLRVQKVDGGETFGWLREFMLANATRVDPPELMELFSRPQGASDAEVRDRAVRFEDWWFFDFRPWRTPYDATGAPMPRVGPVLGWPNGSEPARGWSIRMYEDDPVEGRACVEAACEWLRSEGAQEVPAWVLEDYDSKPWNQR